MARIARITELFLGFMLIVTGLSHFENPYEFLRAILDYRIIHGQVAVIAASILPFAQIVLGICLLFRFFELVSMPLCFVLFCGFLAAQLLAKIRGLDISCGCYGPGHDLPIGPLSISAAVLNVVVSGLIALGKNGTTSAHSV